MTYAPDTSSSNVNVLHVHLKPAVGMSMFECQCLHVHLPGRLSFLYCICTGVQACSWSNNSHIVSYMCICILVSKFCFDIWFACTLVCQHLLQMSPFFFDPWSCIGLGYTWIIAGFFFFWGGGGVHLPHFFCKSRRQFIRLICHSLHWLCNTGTFLSPGLALTGGGFQTLPHH